MVINVGIALSPYKARRRESSHLVEDVRDNPRICAISVGIASNRAKWKTITPRQTNGKHTTRKRWSVPCEKEYKAMLKAIGGEAVRDDLHDGRLRLKKAVCMKLKRLSR